MTSMRLARHPRNVSYLEWTRVDMARRVAWIHPDQAKARKAIAVPLNKDALAVLKARRGINAQWVFTWSGKPVCQVNTKSWRTAVEKASLVDFRWHDLRRIFQGARIRYGFKGQARARRIGDRSGLATQHSRR